MPRTTVSVAYSVDTDGNVFPEIIKWHDGRSWRIQRILHTCQRPDTAEKRFTVLISGHQRNLFFDGLNWQIEPVSGGRHENTNF